MDTPRPVVIAFGNPLRCDDGVAAAVAAQLADVIPAARIMTVHQLLPELAESAAHARVVVFVDASIEGTPGDVRHRLVESEEVGVPGHSLTPARLMGLARSLYESSPPSYLVSVSGEQFGFGTHFSEPVAAAVPTAVRTVADIVNGAD